MAPGNIARAALAVAVLAATGVATAADAAQDRIRAELRRLAERVEKLEKRNGELEAQLAATRSAPALAQRVEALEQANEDLAASLASDRLSEREPEIAIRLKAIEERTNAIAAPARLAEALGGIAVEGNIAAVGQRIDGDARANGHAESQLSWRGDIGITLPAGDIGRGSGEFFTQLRVGQGGDFTEPLTPTFTGAFNSLAFRTGGESEETYAIVAQAWYQLTAPLGERADSPHSLQLTVGKMDPFVFFDQNAVADNEAEKFLNNVFVHNPLLDSGGATGADRYGFAPGLRVAYRNDVDAPDWWQASVALFGAGEGARFGRSFDEPFAIAQLELGRRYYGFDGTYRVYAWRNRQYEGFDFDGTNEDTTAGWGLSVDQEVHEDLTLFARYGHARSGRVPFDHAVTLGGELAGNAWARGADSVGLAWAWLKASDEFRTFAPTADDFGFSASGAEQVAELYYRWQINDQLSLTPDLQYLRRPAADRDAKNITAVALRALYAF